MIKIKNSNKTLLIVVLICLSCRHEFGGVSNDINESKRRGVFVREYEPIVNPMYFNDSLWFDVKVAWLEEKWWSYSDGGTSSMSGYQLIIEIKNKFPNYVGIDWFIERGGYIRSGKYLRACNDYCLMTDFDTLPTDSIEIWQVKVEKEGIGKISIGDFMIIKK